MRTEEIGEAVDVAVVFSKGRPAPRWFVWGGKRHDVKKVESSWKSKQGTAPLLFFSVTGAGGVYELRFNQQSLEWLLDRVHVE